MFFLTFLRCGGPGEQKGVVAKIPWKAEEQVLYILMLIPNRSKTEKFSVCAEDSLKAKSLQELRPLAWRCFWIVSHSHRWTLHIHKTLAAQDLHCIASHLKTRQKTPNLSVDLNNEGKKRIIWQAFVKRFEWFPSKLTLVGFQTFNKIPKRGDAITGDWSSRYEEQFLSWC